MIYKLSFQISLSFSVDEGSFKPDDNLKKIKAISEEALKLAHDLGLVKTKQEAENETAESDEDV